MTTERDPLAGVHPLVLAAKPLVDAVGAAFINVDHAEPSDVPLVWEGVTVAAVRLPPLHGALDRLIDAVETELGDTLRVSSGRSASSTSVERSFCGALLKMLPMPWASAGSPSTTISTRSTADSCQTQRR
jgi:hypothetical protein